MTTALGAREYTFDLAPSRTDFNSVIGVRAVAERLITTLLSNGNPVDSRFGVAIRGWLHEQATEKNLSRIREDVINEVKRAQPELEFESILIEFDDRNTLLVGFKLLSGEIFGLAFAESFGEIVVTQTFS